MSESSKAISIDFTNFILSLASSVQIQMGIVPHPETNKTEMNLPGAKQTINILELLQEKTKGNLTDEEHKLLEGLLFDLRMRYVTLSQGEKK